ncbi:MAG: tetratricopeptide repeat protein [Bacteroidales bacterium]
MKVERKVVNTVKRTEIKSKKQGTVSAQPVNKNISVWIFLLILATSLAYSPMFKNQITNWDDDNYIVKNPWLKEISADNLKEIFSSYYMGNYHPLAMLSLSVDYQIGGLDNKGEINPKPYLITNFMLHLANVLLVFWFISLLVKRWDIALVTAFLFALGTMHVESVAWISERKDVLYALFFVASLISYVKYVDEKNIKFYISSIILFILSLFSKGQAVSLAVSLIAIDFLRERKLLDKKVILEKIPFFVLALIFGIIAIKAQSAGEALQDVDSYPFYKRIGFAGFAFTQYLIKLLVPYKLSAIYPYPDIINRAIPVHYWLFLIPSLLAVYAFYYSLKRSKIIAFCIGFFVINIFLLLQLLPVGSAIYADRYSYIPSIGYHLLIAYFVIHLSDKYFKNKYLVYGMLSIYLLATGIASYQRCKVWNNSLSLWDDTLEKSPKAVVGWNNRGSVRDKNKDRAGAIEDFTRAIVLKPDYTHAFYNRGTSKKELGKELNDSNLIKSALFDFNKAIELNNKFVEAYHNRAMARESLSDYARTSVQKTSLLDSALNDYNKTIEINPKYENAFVNRGVAKGKMGKFKEAIDDFNKALEMTPDNASAWSNRGLAKDNLGDAQGAINDYNIAIEKDPKLVNAYLNRGLVFKKLTNYKASINDFSKVIEMEPRHFSAWYYRGIDRILNNQKNEGCQDLKTAANLGNPYAKQDLLIYCK